MHSCGNVQAEGLSGEVWTVPPQPRGWAEWVPGECEELRAEGLSGWHGEMGQVLSY